jgi:hypothetical protein
MLNQNEAIKAALFFCWKPWCNFWGQHQKHVSIYKGFTSAAERQKTNSEQLLGIMLNAVCQSPPNRECMQEEKPVKFDEFRMFLHALIRLHIALGSDPTSLQWWENG